MEINPPDAYEKEPPTTVFQFGAEERENSTEVYRTENHVPVETSTDTYGSCTSHAREGDQLLLSLSQDHLAATVTILSSVACFWYIVLITKRRKINRERLHQLEDGQHASDRLTRQSRELERCQDCVDYMDTSFGLFIIAAFNVLQYLPQILTNDKCKTDYRWISIGRWHVAAAFKTFWFVVTMVVLKSNLCSKCQAICSCVRKLFNTAERPFNIIALYMLLTSYMLLPVVIDIITYQTFPGHYGYGMCVEVFKISPLCMVVIIFYGSIIISSVTLLLIHWLRTSKVLEVARAAILGRTDDEPTLLSDEGNEYDGTLDNNNRNQSNQNIINIGNNYARNITENYEGKGPDHIKTIDEMVGYDRAQNNTNPDVQVTEMQDKRNKKRLILTAVFEPLLLWLWVVAVLHGNPKFDFSTNIDYANMTLLWTVIAACYTLVSACSK